MLCLDFFNIRRGGKNRRRHKSQYHRDAEKPKYFFFFAFFFYAENSLSTSLANGLSKQPTIAAAISHTAPMRCPFQASPLSHLKRSPRLESQNQQYNSNASYDMCTTLPVV